MPPINRRRRRPRGRRWPRWNRGRWRYPTVYRYPVYYPVYKEQAETPEEAFVTCTYNEKAGECDDGKLLNCLIEQCDNGAVDCYAKSKDWGENFCKGEGEWIDVDENGKYVLRFHTREKEEIQSTEIEKDSGRFDMRKVAIIVILMIVFLFLIYLLK